MKVWKGINCLETQISQPNFIKLITLEVFQNPHDEQISKLSLAFKFDEHLTEKKCKNWCCILYLLYCIQFEDIFTCMSIDDHSSNCNKQETGQQLYIQHFNFSEIILQHLTTVVWPYLYQLYVTWLHTCYKLTQLNTFTDSQWIFLWIIIHQHKLF